MKFVLKILCSIPVVLLSLYYIPVLGIILILFRYYAYRNKKYYSLPRTLIVCGVIILIPRLIDLIFDIFKIKVSGFDITKITLSEFYLRLISYSKLLVSVGIIFLLISIIFRETILKLISKLKTFIKDYINKYEKEKREIREKNDLIIKKQREDIKNTHLVHCPNCGADNTIVGKTGKCKYCRNDISYEK